MEHISTCAQLDKKPCPSGKSLYYEPIEDHWFSGWPGAYCLKCGAEDKDEICIGTCTCPCHEEFWKQYNAYLEAVDEMENNIPKENM